MKKTITLFIMALLFTGIFNISTLNAQMISLDQDQLSNMYRNIAIEKFNEDMNKIKEYYVLLSLDNGTIKRCDYMDSITKMRETITDNYNPGNEYPIDVEYSVYLELYVDYITNLDIENRDAYLPLNSQLNEYFQNSLLQARENNLNAEIKLYENAINKITYLVGRA